MLSSLISGSGAPELTSFFSFDYIVIFLPICLLIYILTPQKARRYMLLALSFGFYWLVSGKLIIYLLLSIFSAHYFGLWLDRIISKRTEALKEAEKEQRKEIKKAYQRRSRGVLALAAALHLGTLLVLKYSAFAATNVNSLLGLFGLDFRFNVPKYLLPLGISFFTLQAVSYLVDVYREKVKADDCLPRLALWLAFFPQITEGPICRYSQTAEQLWSVGRIDFSNLTLGLERLLYGMMKKIVVADRLNPLIKEVFDNYNMYDGGVIALAAVCYTIQLYMDFSGAMDAVMGIAQILGVTMPENFRRPFFSKTISEFWKRWHITLGEWLKDYLFYPVTMSKPMQHLTKAARKRLGNQYGPLLAGSVALLCVWLVNGLWHGAAWNYILFGLYHFVVIMVGRFFAPLIKRSNERLKISPDSAPYRIGQIIRSDILIVIGELIFRANGATAGFVMLKKVVTDFTFSAYGRELFTALGVDIGDFVAVGITVAVVFIISLLSEKGVNIRSALREKHPALHYAAILALIIYIVILGAYGPGYTPVDPIYADF